MIYIVLYILSLTVILVYSIQSLYLFLLSLGLNRNKLPKNVIDDSKLPLVTIQLPVFNEKFVAARLVDSLCSIDYPSDKLQIQVLDDSTDETTSILYQKVLGYYTLGLNIEIIRRESREGFKAGALDNAMKTATGEFIALFDADFVPRPDFLKATLPYFKNEKIGFVQTAWNHFNHNQSSLTYLQDLRLKSHFLAGQLPRFANNMLISFDGSSGIWRRSCIEASGGWQSDTIAEDIDLSLRAQLNGWQGVFCRDIFATAELPGTVNSLKIQQFRWTKGITETLLKHIKSIIKSGIPFKSKLDILLRLSSNIAFPLLLVISLLNIPVYHILKNTNDYTIVSQLMPVFLIALITAFLTLVLINKKSFITVIKRIAVFPLFLAGVAGISVSNSIALFEGLFGIKSAFARTLKTGGKKSKENKKLKAYFIGAVELLFAAYSIWGLYYFINAGDIISSAFQSLIAAGFLIFSVNSLFR
jgi:cellulose synthase/poly-beta-1,6-N-acetylglucosamine synthase-like glycosyltransferase